MLVDLREAYDAMVDMRESRPAEGWKQDERERFLERLLAEGRVALLEVGAGTGLHGRFFADAGLEVVCTDASAAMVDACRAKGLVAHQLDFLRLDRSWTFDAVFAMNCLLHVPPATLPSVLDVIADVLEPGGLFFLGQYGGAERAGVLDDDVYEPKRFFSSLSDDSLLAAVAPRFDVVDFHRVEDVNSDVYFQSLTLRTRGRGRANVG